MPRPQALPLRARCGSRPSSPTSSRAGWDTTRCGSSTSPTRCRARPPDLVVIKTATHEAVAGSVQAARPQPAQVEKLLEALISRAYLLPKMSFPRSRERGAPVLIANRYGEFGDLTDAASGRPPPRGRGNAARIERAVARLQGRPAVAADAPLFALTSKRSGSVHGSPARSTAASKRTMVPVSRSPSSVKRR
jgi:hypothetical protein